MKLRNPYSGKDVNVPEESADRFIALGFTEEKPEPKRATKRKGRASSADEYDEAADNNE